MDRWSGILRIPFHSNGNRACYNVAASLCLSPPSKSLSIPSVNVIFFSGDRVLGTGNPVIERFSDLRNIAEILVLKFGGSVNAWVVEASVFNGPFAVYKDFIPSVNHLGEPKSYDPTGFPASGSTVTLLSNCLTEVKSVLSHSGAISASELCQRPKTYVLGFSKGGTVLNQLVSELSTVDSIPNEELAGQQIDEHHNKIVPSTTKGFLESIREIHYLDVGINSGGAYITDKDTIERISRGLELRDEGIRFVLHGTPRQWCDSRRSWIPNEKDRLVRMVRSGSQTSRGKLQVSERFYFAEREPDLQMHFEIIEKFCVS